MSDAPATIARQHLQTNRLMGVDFIPVRIDLPAAPAPAAPLPTPTTPAIAVSPIAVPAIAVTDESELARRGALLEDVRRRHDASCPHCCSVRTHSRTVFGEGDPAARLMFIGEAPGEEEDRTGRPFVGRAGQKLDEIIAAMGMRRQDVYIANILKSRPPENRTPLLPEVEACSPFLREQIMIISPAVIVALGGPAAKMLLQTDTGITRIRGQWGVYVDAERGLRIAVMPTFHPAYLLRNYTVDTRRKMWSDMQSVRTRLSGEG